MKHTSSRILENLAKKGKSKLAQFFNYDPNLPGTAESSKNANVELPKNEVKQKENPSHQQAQTNNAGLVVDLNLLAKRQTEIGRIIENSDFSSVVKHYFQQEKLDDYYRDLEAMKTNPTLMQVAVGSIRSLYVMPDILLLVRKHDKTLLDSSEFCEKLHTELQMQERQLFNLEKENPDAAKQLRMEVEKIRLDPKFFSEVATTDNYSLYEDKSVSSAFNQALETAKKMPKSDVKANPIDLIPKSMVASQAKTVSVEPPKEEGPRQRSGAFYKK